MALVAYSIWPPVRAAEVKVISSELHELFMKLYTSKTPNNYNASKQTKTTKITN